jgi:hypothetical protein
MYTTSGPFTLLREILPEGKGKSRRLGHSLNTEEKVI